MHDYLHARGELLSDYSTILRVGLELEGGWKDHPSENSIGAWHYDGSVSLPASPRLAIGEFVSNPMYPGEIGGWLHNAYPDYVNHTCGLHVHLSMKSEAYVRVAQSKFAAAFRASMADWSNFLTEKEQFLLRLSGRNTYCQDLFLPHEQMIGVNNERYAALNYCYGKHRTLEVRLLPMFRDTAQAYRSILAVVNTVRGWLVHTSTPVHRRTVIVADQADYDTLVPVRQLPIHPKRRK